MEDRDNKAKIYKEMTLADDLEVVKETQALDFSLYESRFEVLKKSSTCYRN